MRYLFLIALSMAGVGIVDVLGAAEIRPIVAAEEEVYRYEPANNGAGPSWCFGSTCIARIGEDVFVSGLETIKDAKPLNNTRWMLYRRHAGKWQLWGKDDSGRTREPCPIGVFPDGSVFLSANPTLTPPDTYAGPAEPQILRFPASGESASFETMLPMWQGKPPFSEHSYRSFAVDGPAREMILFQNIGYGHAEWAFHGRDGKWSASGQLKWPWGAEYSKPQPIRICYPTVQLKNRAVYYCGVSDIVEPNPAWRDYKRKLTGQEWDYDFRRLFFTWTTDVTKEGFRPWIEIASREKTAGHVFPCDLLAEDDGSVHVLWYERALDQRLRKDFFPDAKQGESLNWAVVRNGQVVMRKAILSHEEGASGAVPGRGRFHLTPDGRLFVIYYASGRDADGKSFEENRLAELDRKGALGPVVKVPLQRPMSVFFTASIRAGNAPSDVIDMLGDMGSAMRYASIRLGK